METVGSTRVFTMDNTNLFNLGETNMLEVMNVSNEQTMTSVEIAQLTGKRHDNVLTDIRKMLVEIHSPEKSGDYIDGRGRNQPCLLLNKEESLCLVAGYNAALRMNIIKRWGELEAQAKQGIQLPNFTDPIAACEAWMVQYKRNTELEGIVLREAPKVEFYDNFVDAKTLFTMEEAAKEFGIGRSKFMEYLRSIKALTLKNLPQQILIDQGKMCVKVTPWTKGKNSGVSNTAMVTAKGLIALKKKMEKDGVI